MSSDIISFLNLENLQEERKFIFATKDFSSDLNFFFGDVISFYIKQNYSIVFVNLAQSSSHFSHLLSKWGINLRVLREQKKVDFVDVMSDAGSLLTDTKKPNLFSSLLTDIDKTHCLKPLYESIKDSMDKLSSSQPKGFVVFIDEINVLTSLGVTLKSIHLFFRHLFSEGLAGVPVNFLAGSFVDEHDVENGRVVAYLNKFADMNVRVEGLKTGYSKDTHGKITLITKNRIECSSKQQTQFFKVGDKGAKLLTLGL